MQGEKESEGIKRLRLHVRGKRDPIGLIWIPEWWRVLVEIFAVDYYVHASRCHAAAPGSFICVKAVKVWFTGPSSLRDYAGRRSGAFKQGFISP